MQMRKGKSPRSAFRPTINPQDTFPTGSPGSSCCGLRNLGLKASKQNCFPTALNKSLLFLGLRLLGEKNNSFILCKSSTNQSCFSSRRNSDSLMSLRLSYPICKMGIIPSISVGLLISDRYGTQDYKSFSYAFYMKKTLH